MVRLIHDVSVDSAPDLDEEALRWVVRLTSGVSTPEDHQAFRCWRDQSAAHSQALGRARVLWRQLDTSLPQVERQRSERSRRRRLLWLAAPLAASVVLAIGGTTGYLRIWRYDAVTSVGERRSLALADGSIVVLGGDSALKIDLGPSMRRLELARGEAVFHARHDPRRPFVVVAGAMRIRDIGTVFDVARARTQTTVVVEQGRVEAYVDDQRTVLAANQSLKAVPGRLGSVEAADPYLSSSWTRGRLNLEDKSLSDIVQAVQPYYKGQILLLDRTAERRRLSAAIDLDHIDEWLSALSRSHAIRLSRIGSLTVLY